MLLGRTVGRFPTDQGFDEWYGIPNSTDESVSSFLPGFAESGVGEENDGWSERYDKDANPSALAPPCSFVREVRPTQLTNARDGRLTRKLDGV